ncbi:MAG: HlyD family efflux transporter periplasmic adaptor subunit [Woeseia sp.]
MRYRNFSSGVVLVAAAILNGCDATDDAYRVVGQLESDRIEIAADVAEPLLQIHVVEGQAVAKGEPLLTQDSSRIAAKLDEAEALLAQSRARLDELTRGPREEQIAAARASLAGAIRESEFRETEFERAEQVLERKLASRESVDRAKALLDAANADRDVQEARLQELLEGTTVEELQQAQNAVHQVEAQISLLQIDERRHSAFAPVDGVVDSILLLAGERPSAGQPVLIFLSGEQPYARVYVPEALRISVAPGTAARIWVDGLAEPIPGRVRWVSSDAAFTPYFALTERDRGRLSFAAKVDVDSKAAGRRLPDGVPVEVEFLPENRNK